MLIESANAPILGMDIEGSLTEWNKKAVSITGAPLYHDLLHTTPRHPAPARARLRVCESVHSPRQPSQRRARRPAGRLHGGRDARAQPRRGGGDQGRVQGVCPAGAAERAAGHRDGQLRAAALLAAGAARRAAAERDDAPLSQGRGGRRGDGGAGHHREEGHRESADRRRQGARRFRRQGQ
eukprot:650765-Prymnesium_polylepis.1